MGHGMKDPNTLVTPNAIKGDIKQRVADMIRAHPELTYRAIGARFGMSNGTVGRIANQMGVTRKADDEIKPPPPRHTPLATDGECRGTGVYATDRQMAARNGMTLRQWLDKQRAREGA